MSHGWLRSSWQRWGVCRVLAWLPPCLAHWWLSWGWGVGEGVRGLGQQAQEAAKQVLLVEQQLVRRHGSSRVGARRRMGRTTPPRRKGPRSFQMRATRMRMGVMGVMRVRGVRGVKKGYGVGSPYC
ncbi:hypothetical protein V8C86DRAFT_2479371 [Haematococcus lacustris]